MSRQLSDEQLVVKYGHLDNLSMEKAVGACLTQLDSSHEWQRAAVSPHCPFCDGAGCRDNHLLGRRLPLMRELQKVVGNKIAAITDRGCTKTVHHHMPAAHCIRILRVDNDMSNPDHKRPCAGCEYARRVRPVSHGILGEPVMFSAGHEEMHRHLENMEVDVQRRLDHRQRLEQHQNRDESQEVMARLRQQVAGLQQGQARLSGEKQKANEKVARRDKQIERLEAQVKDLKDQLRGLKGSQGREDSGKVAQLRHELQRLQIKYEAYVVKAEGKERTLRGQLKTEFNNGKASVQSARSAAERTLTNNNKKLRKDNKALTDDHARLLKIAQSFARELRDVRHLLEVNDIKLAGYECNDHPIKDLLG